MSVLFDGTTSKLVLAQALPSAVPLTYACFFKPTAIGIIQVLINCDNGATVTNSFAHYIQTSGVIEGRSLNTSQALVDTTDVAVANKWQSAAFVTQTSTSRYVALNGNFSAQNTTSRTPAGLSEFIIGAQGSGTFSFNGRIAEVAVWLAALTPGELQAFHSGVPANKIRPESLSLYMPLTKRVGITDLAQRQFVLTNTNCLASEDHPQILQPTGIKPWQ